MQCGFCIPGMIVTADELLRQNPDPTRDEVKRALRRNLCRCTGYVKIVDAVQLAGKFLRGEARPADYTPDADAPMIGTSFPRPSAYAKATGTALFGADIRMPDALEIAVVRAPLAHALIKGIDTSAAERMPGVAGVMTAKDIRGTNRLKYQVADRPILCDTKVRLLGDAIAIVAADTKEHAEAAVEAVKVGVRGAAGPRHAGQGDGRGRAADPRRAAQPVLPAADHQGRRVRCLRERRL